MLHHKTQVFKLNSALLSRSLIYQLNILSEESLKKIIIRAEKLSQNKLLLENDGKKLLIQMSGGDARILINLVEQIFSFNRKIGIHELKEVLSLNIPNMTNLGIITMD